MLGDIELGFDASRLQTQLAAARFGSLRDARDRALPRLW